MNERNMGERNVSERAKAIGVLKEAREILAQRLQERVLEASDEILADARGDSYMNDIDGVYEQIGMRLSHVNQMLSNLPAENDAAFSSHVHANHTADDLFTVATDPMPNADAIVTDTLPAIAGPVYLATPALPAPRMEAAAEQPISFQTFASQIQANDLLAAGQTLAELFELDEPRAIACTVTFAEHLHSEPGFLRKVTQLRHELHDGRKNAALLLLLECFGMTSVEAVGVLHSIRRRLRIED